MRGVIGSTSHYATVIGIAYLVPLILTVPVGGIVADRFNRSNILVGSMLLMHLSTFAIGFSTKYLEILVTRIILGFSQGLFIPASLSLIVDYFPPARQTMAFAILGVSSSFGGAIINETTLFISIWGWRDTFRIIAGILLGFTVIAFFILNEPARGKFTFIKKGQNAT